MKSGLKPDTRDVDRISRRLEGPAPRGPCGASDARSARGAGARRGDAPRSSMRLPRACSPRTARGRRRRCVYGFPETVLISVNDEVVHGIPGPRRLETGDLVKLDVTVEKDGYVADAARTVIVESGSDLARRLAACARAAFASALDGREGGHQGQRDQPCRRVRSAPVRVHRRARTHRSRRRPADSRAAVGAESLRPVAARCVDRRSRADHRTDHQRGIRSNPRGSRWLDDADDATAVSRRITSTRSSSPGIGRSC